MRQTSMRRSCSFLKTTHILEKILHAFYYMNYTKNQTHTKSFNSILNNCMSINVG
jgi:hypothetical protein